MDLNKDTQHLSRQQIIDQMTTNMLAANLLYEHEVPMHLSLLADMSTESLLIMLFDSYKMREEADANKDYYMIDPVHLCPN